MKGQRFANALVVPLILAGALSGCSRATLPDAYAADDDYLDIRIGHRQWAAAPTPVLANIIVCEGQIRFHNTLQPEPVCEASSKGAGQVNYAPARFVQLTDWLEQNGYGPASFIHIDDDHSLWVSVLKGETRGLEGAEYEDFYGHKPGYEFSGTGPLTSGAIRPVR
ncbi:hypothetical protein [Stutzerimonas sp. 381-2]